MRDSLLLCVFKKYKVGKEVGETIYGFPKTVQGELLNINRDTVFEKDGILEK